MTPPTSPARAITINKNCRAQRFANGFHGISSCGYKGMYEISFFS
jgi:hypothetical protein